MIKNVCCSAKRGSGIDQKRHTSSCSLFVLAPCSGRCLSLLAQLHSDSSDPLRGFDKVVTWLASTHLQAEMPHSTITVATRSVLIASSDESCPPVRFKQSVHAVCHTDPPRSSPSVGNKPNERRAPCQTSPVVPNLGNISRTCTSASRLHFRNRQGAARLRNRRVQSWMDQPKEQPFGEAAPKRPPSLGSAMRGGTTVRSFNGERRKKHSGHRPIQKRTSRIPPVSTKDRSDSRKAQGEESITRVPLQTTVWCQQSSPCRKSQVR